MRCLPDTTCRVLLSLITCLLVTVPARAAPPWERPVSGLQPRISISSSYDTGGQVRASVHVSLPQRAMVFRVEGDEYHSEMQVTVLAERKGRRIGGALKTARARASSFQATRNRGVVDCQLLVEIPDQKPMDLRVITEVTGTTRRWEETFRFDPGEGSQIPWYFELVSWNVDEPSGEVLLGHDIDSLEAEIRLGYHATRAGSASGPLSLVFSLEDEAGKRAVLQRVALPQRDDRRRLSLSAAFPADEMPFGNLMMHVWIVLGGVDSTAVNPPLRFVNMSVDLSDDAVWRRHLGWLDGLDGSEDISAMKDASPQQRRGLWDAFWLKAGGPEARIAHLQRILEADERFGGFGRGSLSDMGRTFIKYGAPDNVERRENNLSSPGNWQIWYYYQLGTSFIFYDAYGMGDFRLYSQAPI